MNNFIILMMTNGRRIAINMYEIMAMEESLTGKIIVHFMDNTKIKTETNFADLFVNQEYEEEEEEICSADIYFEKRAN